MESLQILIPLVVGVFILGLCGYFLKDYWKPAKALKHDIDETIKLEPEEKFIIRYRYKETLQNKKQFSEINIFLHLLLLISIEII